MNLTDKAYDIIKNEIITCLLQPGQQIVQSQLAERHQIGMTPIREALQRLVWEGFVQAIPRFGYVVSPVTFSDVAEIFEFRALLESTAVRLAATRGSEQQLKAIAAAADFTYVYTDRQSYSDCLARDAGFHRVIATAACSQRLADAIAKNLEELTRVFHLGLGLKDCAEEMRAEHLALAAALGSRDPGQAEQIIGAHIARSRQRVLEAIMGGVSSDLSKIVGQVLQVKAPES